MGELKTRPLVLLETSNYHFFFIFYFYISLPREFFFFFLPGSSDNIVIGKGSPLRVYWWIGLQLHLVDLCVGHFRSCQNLNISTSVTHLWQFSYASVWLWNYAIKAGSSSVSSRGYCWFPCQKHWWWWWEGCWPSFQPFSLIRFWASFILAFIQSCDVHLPCSFFFFFLTFSFLECKLFKVNPCYWEKPQCCLSKKKWENSFLGMSKDLWLPV